MISNADIASLYEQYNGYLMSILGGRCGYENARDLAHDVWVNLMEYEKPVRKMKEFLAQSARNRASSFNSKYRPALAEIPDCPDRSEAGVRAGDELEAVNRRKNRLSDTRRRVLELAAGGFSHTEIARILHITEATSRARLSEARNQIAA